MRDLCRLIGWTIVDLLRSRATLEAEIWTLRQQIIVLRRAAPKKLSFCTIDRLIFVGLYRLFPRVRDALAVIKPDTVVRWHRAETRGGRLDDRYAVSGQRRQCFVKAELLTATGRYFRR